MKYQILIIGPTPPPFHGVSIMTQYLIESYLRDTFKICFLDISDRRKLSNLGQLDFRNISLAFYHFFKFIKIFLINNPKVIYIPFSQSFWGYIRDLFFLIPSRIFNKKILIHLHGSAFDDFYNSMNFLLKIITNYIFNGKVWGIVLGKKLKNCFNNLIQEKKIFVIPNGIKPIMIRCEHYTNNQKEAKNIRILYLSNLRISKGFFSLLTIIPAIIKNHPNVHFTFAGEKTNNLDIQKANSFIYQNDLVKYIDMSGIVIGQEKEMLLLNSDIFVFPPIEKEGQPLVILEAMAAGLPIISSNIGTINEMIINGKNGFLISVGDSDALLKSISILIENKNLREKMGKESKKIFENFYSVEKWKREMQHTFNKVLSA